MAKYKQPTKRTLHYVLLRVLFRKRVLPIALVLKPNVGGLTWHEYNEELFGQQLLHFRYGQVGVRDLSSIESTDAARQITI
jgi:hypothetical protein